MFVGYGAKFEGLLRDIAQPAPEHVLPPPPEGPPDMSVLLPLAEKWAYEILGPPGAARAAVVDSAPYGAAGP